MTEKSKWMQNMEWMKKVVTPKTLAIFMTVLYVGSLIPLFMIAKYNYPSADDYSIGEICRHAWTDTHSVFTALGQAVAMAVDNFLYWMGCFSSSFLMAVHPGVFGEELYFMTTYIMVGMLSLGTIYLLRAIFVKAMKMNPWIIHSITMFMLFVTVQRLVGRNEALYWYCGAVNYIFMHGVSLFFYGAMISMFFEKNKKKRIFDMIFACVCGAVAGTGNYMTALNGCIVVAAVMLVWCFLVRKEKQSLQKASDVEKCKHEETLINLKKDFKHFSIPAFFYVGAFLLNCFAPGNSYRAEGTTGINPVKAIFLSFYYALTYCLSEWSGWITLLLVILIVVLFYHAAGEIDFTFPCPLLVVVFSYCVLSAMITPPLFAVGNIAAGRLQALIYIMYILLLTLDVCYVAGWVRKKMDGRKEVQQSFSLNSCYVIVTCVAFLFFGSVLCIIPNTHYYTFTSAITDLANGSAKAYGEAQKARAELLNSSAEDSEIVLDKLPAEPELLYFTDITSDVESWENRAMARYYNIKSVVRKEE